MATVELPEEDANTLARGMKLLQTLNSNPAARPLLEKAIKAVDPNVRTTEEQVSELLAPQISVVNKIAEELKAEREERAAERQRDTEAAAERAMNDAFSHLRAREGLTEDGERAVKELMVDRKIADPAAAFALFQKQNPTPSVSEPSYVPQTWDFEKAAVDNDVAGLFSAPDRWADQQVGQILTEMRKEGASA